jgi:transposase
MPAIAPHTPEQRVQLVLAVLRKEESIEAIARKANVSSTTLNRWRDDFVNGGQAALGSGKAQQTQLARQVEILTDQLQDRDQVIGELTVANRILKKTSGLS